MNEPASAQKEAGGNDSVQYVLYVGTNDMDTNRPVFTQARSHGKGL